MTIEKVFLLRLFNAMSSLLLYAKQNAKKKLPGKITIETRIRLRENLANYSKDFSLLSAKTQSLDIFFRAIQWKILYGGMYYGYM